MVASTGLARSDHPGIHRSDEVSAAEYDQRRTILGPIASEKPATEKPGLEVLQCGPLGQRASVVSLHTEHRGPERRDEYLAIAESTVTPHGGKR
jgi:hypothetical protein